VTVYHGGHSGSRRIEIKRGKVVKYIEVRSRGSHNFTAAKILGPIAPVHVSPDRDYGGQLPKFVKNRKAADVTRMNDQVTSLELFEGFVAQKPVRVRNHTDSHGMAQMI
jgi:hypothetical protein